MNKKLYWLTGLGLTSGWALGGLIGLGYAALGLFVLVLIFGE